MIFDAKDPGRRLTGDVGDGGERLLVLHRRAVRAPAGQHSDADGWLIDSPGSIAQYQNVYNPMTSHQYTRTEHYDITVLQDRLAVDN